jgi:cation transport ATPase
MDSLIVISTTASILFGIALAIIGYSGVELGSEMHKMKVMENAHLFEISATILVILSIGKTLEAYSKSKTVQKLTDLASNSVTSAVLFTPENPDGVTFEGKEEEVQVEFVDEGDLIKVANGQTVPCDGVVVFGQGNCNEAMLTGESLLQKKVSGSEVFGGSQFKEGCIIVRVTRNSENSSLS